MEDDMLNAQCPKCKRIMDCSSRQNGVYKNNKYERISFHCRNCGYMFESMNTEVGKKKGDDTSEIPDNFGDMRELLDDLPV